MNKTKITTLIIFGFVLLSHSVSFAGDYSCEVEDWETIIPWGYETSEEKCPYLAELKCCFAANSIAQENEGEPDFEKVDLSLEIKEFICPSELDKDKILFQIILDKNFSEIDAEILLELNKLIIDEEKYFKEDGITFFQKQDEIRNKFKKNWYFWIKYEKACASIPQNFLACKPNTPTDKISSFLENENGYTPCTYLFETKLRIYRNTIMRVLNKNKVKVQLMKKRAFMKELRWKYDKLLEKLLLNLWYIERLIKKWPSKTKNAN